jgi:hypothetical protein
MMIRRSVFGLVVAAGLVACVAETTNLGGPRGSQASATSAQDGGDVAAEQGLWSPVSLDGGRPDRQSCWYVWPPTPGDEPGAYLLPAALPGYGPDFDPATWNPHNVRVDIGLNEAPWKAIGPYREAVTDCGSEHGWYYLLSGDSGPPTSYALCPATSAAIMDSASFQLAAFGWCRP